MYGRSVNGYSQYSLPVHNSVSSAVLGSVPEGLQLGTICENQSCRKDDTVSSKIIPTNILEVGRRFSPSKKISDDPASAGGHRIEPHSRHSAIGRPSRGKSSKTNLLNFKNDIAT